MRISRKILLPILVLAAGLVLMTGMALFQGHQVKLAQERAIAANREMILASEVRSISRAIQRDALNMILTSELKDRSTFDAKIADRAEQLQAHATELSGRLSVADRAAMQSFVPLQRDVIAAIKAVRAQALASTDGGALYALFGATVRPAERAASKLTDAFIDEKAKDITELEAGATRASDLAQLFEIIAGIFTIAVGVGVGVKVAIWGIARPAAQLTVEVERIAAGDYSPNGAMRDRTDEIGDIARALDTFRAQLADVARLKREQETVVSALGEGLQRLAQNDLTVALADGFPANYETVRADFKATVRALAGTIEQIEQSAGTVNSGVLQIGAGANDLSQRTERHAANLEETAVALNEITVTVQKASEELKRAEQIAGAADSEAERSGSVVNAAIDAMHGIQQSSESISEIIGVIDEIAIQTNLLALNAGVEAGRAGVAGLGFNVIATDVRALAQRSTESAQEIKGLISRSAAQISNGVKLVQNTGTTLRQIGEEVKRLRHIIAEISGSADEQAAALAQVNSTINQLDQALQQNATMAEESATAGNVLRSEADRLKQLVAGFRIDRGRPVEVRRAA